MIPPIPMIATVQIGQQLYQTALTGGIDLSLPLIAGPDSVNCFYAPMVEYEPVRMGSFVGSVQEGGVVNFFNVRLNPHGNGTHTECVGHIAAERFVIRECLEDVHFRAKLVSIYPQRMEDGDRVVTADQVREIIAPGEVEALLIRTLPNVPEKQQQQYSGTNPPYLAPEALEWMVHCGIRHLLVDLPSVDREEDEGKLAAHKAFWRYPGSEIRRDCTITELFYAPNEVKDGYYLLTIQIAAFDLDASPSRPILFPLERA